MTRRLPALLAALVLGALAPRSGLSQSPCFSPNTSNSCSLQVTGTVKLNSVATLSINSSNTTLTAPKATDFGAPAGVTSAGPTVTVLSNGAYALSTSAPTNWSGPSGTSKPSSDLTISVNDGAFVALGQLAHPSFGTAAAGTPYIVKYNTKYNWTTDKPGTYTLTVSYTLTAP
jgi:hypothetical protein